MTDPCAPVASDPLAIVLSGIHEAALSKWRLGLRELWFEVGIAIIAALIDVVALALPEIGLAGTVTTLGASLTAFLGILRTYAAKSQRSEEAKVRIDNHYQMLCARIAANPDDPAHQDARTVIAEAIRAWCQGLFDASEQYLCP